MQSPPKKTIGVFLGRLQPQHPGHERMIERIFAENDQVVLCVGSAQRLEPDDPARERNPLSIRRRLKTLRAFLASSSRPKPYSIVTARDIEPDSTWPIYLKQRCHLRDDTINTVYFADRISDGYLAGLESVGLKVKLIPRTKFRYRATDNRTHRLSSATEIRDLEPKLKR